MSKTKAPAVCKKCGLQENDEEKQPNCPRCEWKGYNYKPGQYRKRYTFAQAQQIAREMDDALWQMVRRRAVRHLQERGAEEIGSSDVSCVAIEFIQNETIVVENGRITHDDSGQI